MYKKIVCLLLCVFCLISSSIFSSNAAQDISDKPIDIKANSNDGGAPAFSDIYRKKYNKTSVYCYNKASSGGSVFCWVHRKKSTSNADISTKGSQIWHTVDRYYGSKNLGYNGPQKNAVTIPKGTYRYLKNYVRKDSYTHAAVGFIMRKEHKAYHMLWSPDSV